MPRKSIIVLVAFFAFTAALSAQDGVARTITVTGEALIMVVPDEAVITVGVETYNVSLQKGQELNAAAGKRLLDAVKALGVDEKLVKTDDLTVEVGYKNNNRPSSGIDGYMLRRMYVVTLKDVNRVSALVNAALMNGANMISGIDYRTTGLRGYRDAARTAAIRAAREKAAALLAELKCGVGKPRTVSEVNLGYLGYGRGAMSQNVMTSEGGEVSSDLDVDTIPAGQIGIRAKVQVVFDIATG